jgi:hypothetical protein
VFDVLGANDGVEAGADQRRSIYNSNEGAFGNHSDQGRWRAAMRSATHTIAAGTAPATLGPRTL